MKVPFLGHVLYGDGISVDTTKVQEVLDWKAPTMVSEVKSEVSSIWLVITVALSQISLK
jgi:hypothetical protein